MRLFSDYHLHPQGHRLQPYSQKLLQPWADHARKIGLRDFALTDHDRYHRGIDFDEIEVFYLAGGFGRHLKVPASRRIGLIPDLPDARIVQAGNAAIEGACIALLSRSRRRELEELVARVEHCRLETHPSFFDYFVEGCQFKAVESANRVSG